MASRIRTKPAAPGAAAQAMTGPGPLPVANRVCVIGAGLGGLALAIRLQAGGIATTLIEARDHVGGRAEGWEESGFVFCGGPAALNDRAGLEDLWSLTGKGLADDVTLFAVAPQCRYSWPDGASFDFSADEAILTREIARLAPGDLAGYEIYRQLADGMVAEFRGSPGPAPFADWTALARALPQVVRLQGWRSLASAISAHVKSSRLREVLAAPALMLGANPFTVSALMAGLLRQEQVGGLWWPEGGMGKLVAALAERFIGLGGTLRLHDPVVRIHTLGTRVHEVETQSGARARFGAVASNADPVHTYRDLLGETPRGRDLAARLRKRRYAPGLFVVNFALEGTWPGIPHRMALLGHRFRALIEDIYTHGVLPADQIIWLSHPSVTDPSIAPAGKSVFQAAMPVPHRGKLPIDWETIGPLLEQRVLDEVGRRLVPDIHDRIIIRSHATPRDAALDFNAYHGSGYGLDPGPLYGGALPLRKRDPDLDGLYLVGTATQPGGGMAAVLASARHTARLMQEDMA